MTTSAGTRPGGDGHVHLKLAEEAPPKTRRPWDRARWPVLGLSVLAVALFAVSFFLPWWRFWLYAPQYPRGLGLVISLTGMSGDVHEIDLLNHYIGMKHLAEAAPLERQIAGWGVGIVGVTTLALLLGSGRKVTRFVAIPAVVFPIAFLVDSFYWLYSFGHSLDPKAPLRIGAFTPQMFGNGQIGQFETFARPELGFWLATAGVACAIVATILRSRVCAGCTDAKTCGLVCSRAMVLPDPHTREEAS